MNTYITEAIELDGNDDAALVVRYSDTNPAATVMYAYGEAGDLVTPWKSTPFQSVNIKRGDACRLVSEWLDECEGR